MVMQEYSSTSIHHSIISNIPFVPLIIPPEAYLSAMSLDLSTGQQEQ